VFWEGGEACIGQGITPYVRLIRWEGGGEESVCMFVRERERFYQERECTLPLQLVFLLLLSCMRRRIHYMSCDALELSFSFFFLDVLFLLS
jgi:hypothetical protein